MSKLTALIVLLFCISFASSALGKRDQNGSASRQRGTRTRPAARDQIVAQRQRKPSRSIGKREYCPAGPRSSSAPTCTCTFGGSCGGLSLNFGTDNNNCGGCNIRCGEGESCASGYCTSAPVTFPFRIEGNDNEGTIFEGLITTSGHSITTASGGTHNCDGTNNGANPAPGGTASTAIADAGRCAGFGFDGTYSTSFQDFFITSIGNTAQTGSQFWGILRNRAFTPSGGCQEQGRAGDEILWAFDAFNAAGFLSLSGPSTASLGTPTTYTVVSSNGNGGADQPVAGVTVMGQTSDASGQVSLTFNTPGVVGIKASRTGYIRSNRVDVRVS